MFHRTWRRVAIAAAGLLTLTLVGACSDDAPDAKDLDGNRAGAMADYGIDKQFKATEPLSFPILYNNHPNYP
ncbi:sugar ABC transporter substrate-binding protein, partial [Streptomyces sp. NPDC052644]